MYNYYQQQPNMTTNYTQRPQQPMNLGFLKGHPVSSLEEVKATSIDFDGSIFYFPDIANKKIYTKVVGLDGVASLNMYELKPLPQENQLTGDFITRQEFDSAMTRISELFAAQQQKTKEPTAPSEFKEVF